MKDNGYEARQTSLLYVLLSFFALTTNAQTTIDFEMCRINIPVKILHGSRKYPYPPQGRPSEIPRGRGVSKAIKEKI